MRKILGLLVLCLLFTSCSECLHDGATRQRLFEDEDCTCIVIKPLSGATSYSFAGEKVPVPISVVVDSNKQIITPQIGRQYKIRYSYWRCTDCQNVGKYRIQDVMILGESNGKN